MLTWLLCRDLYIEIKVNGAKYLPWRDAIVASNPSNADERWSTAKEIIAREKVPGGDLSLVYQVGSRLRSELIALGYPSREALLQANPAEIPLEKIKGVGAKKAGQIRAVLTAERTKSPVLPPPGSIPPAKTLRVFRRLRILHQCGCGFRPAMAHPGRVRDGLHDRGRLAGKGRLAL